MNGQNYLENVVTLDLNIEKCIGCGMCEMVCPHAVFEVAGGKAGIIDRDCCMECGACSRNCPVEAISVEPGVGCAIRVLNETLTGKAVCDCSGESDQSCC